MGGGAGPGRGVGVGVDVADGAPECFIFYVGRSLERCDVVEVQVEVGDRGMENGRDGQSSGSRKGGTGARERRGMGLNTTQLGSGSCVEITR